MSEMTSPGLMSSRHPQSPASQEAWITDHASGPALLSSYFSNLTFIQIDLKR